MKKLLFLLFALPIYAYSAPCDELEEAILEVNVEKVEKILEEMGSLTDSQKMAYASLAQHVIDKFNMENYIKKAEGGPESGLLLLGAGGFVMSALFIALYFACEYDYARDGIKPIGISAAILSMFYVAAEKGAHNEKEMQDAKKKKLKDALHIQKKIYLA